MNSELLLFFFITYSIISNTVLILIAFYNYCKNNELRQYNEELILELVKTRKK